MYTAYGFKYIIYFEYGVVSNQMFYNNLIEQHGYKASSVAPSYNLLWPLNKLVNY